MFIYILLLWATFVFIAKLYSKHQVTCVVSNIYYKPRENGVMHISIALFTL